MPLVTELTRALGILHPVVQGGMMWVGLPRLVAAVSETGGLGILTGLTAGSPEGLRAAIRETRKLTSKPFAVNLTFLPSISPPPYLEYAQVVIDEGGQCSPPADSVHELTRPSQDCRDRWRPCCRSCHRAVQEARHLRDPQVHVHPSRFVTRLPLQRRELIEVGLTAVRKFGADMLSIDGFECAGHPGEDDIGGLVLLALASRTFGPLGIPYLASGGIANGRGLAAALSLGACGVNCGTLFMATEESYIDEKIKLAMVQASERDTTHVFRTLNNTARVFKSVLLPIAPADAPQEQSRDGGRRPRGQGRQVSRDPAARLWTARQAGLRDGRCRRASRG